MRESEYMYLWVCKVQQRCTINIRYACTNKDIIKMWYGVKWRCPLAAAARAHTLHIQKYSYFLFFFSVLQKSSHGQQYTHGAYIQLTSFKLVGRRLDIKGNFLSEEFAEYPFDVAALRSLLSCAYFILLLLFSFFFSFSSSLLHAAFSPRPQNWNTKEAHTRTHSHTHT